MAFADKPLDRLVANVKSAPRAAPSAQPAAIDAAAFAAAMMPFAIPPGTSLAVGVSGGADSMALLLLLRRWCATHGCTLTALTVDHCLRDGSGEEAARVAGWCADLGLRHEVLAWRDGAAHRSASRSPQAAARRGRYDLLTAWCRAHGHTHLCVAHHADDQVETFFLRLSRGSGVDGLAAMAAESRRGGVVLLRPLLDAAKDTLCATCAAAGQAWIEDPSNHNRKSARVRFRQARALLAAEGFDEARLLATVGHMQRARKALESEVDALMMKACPWNQWGVVDIDLAAFVAASTEIQLRALARVLMIVSGDVYRPRFERLQRLHRVMLSGPWRDATLHGCQVVRTAAGYRVYREAAAITDVCAVTGEAPVVWDQRFRLQMPAGSVCNMVARCVTPAAWKTAAVAGDLPQIDPEVRRGLPMLTDELGLAAIPWARYLRADLQSGLKQPILCEFTPGIADFEREDDDSL